MQILQLKERKQEFQCLSEYQNIVRIANRLAKDQYKFKPKKTTDTVKKFPDAHSEIKRERSRERLANPTWKKGNEAYIHLKNLPFDCTQEDICQFMQGIRLRNSVILQIFI